MSGFIRLIQFAARLARYSTLHRELFVATDRPIVTRVLAATGAAAAAYVLAAPAWT
jgi:hypothetical protein